MVWKTTQRLCLVMALVVFTFVACGIFNPSKNDLYPLEGNITFKFMESYEKWEEKENPQIMLWLETEKVYPTGSYTLMVDMFIQGKTIDIHIDGIKNWGSGPEIIVPAGWMTFLKVPNGEYNLNFTSRSKFRDSNDYDSYTVLIDEKSILVKNKSQSFTSPEYSLYWRYPKNSFAYLCGTSLQDSCICDAFIDSLQQVIKIEPFTFPEQGVRPYPSFSSGYFHNSPAQFFKYIKEEDYSRAGDFLKHYSQEKLKNYKGFGISLTGWNNVNYLSWMYAGPGSVE